MKPKSHEFAEGCLFNIETRFCSIKSCPSLLQLPLIREHGLPGLVHLLLNPVEIFAVLVDSHLLL